MKLSGEILENLLGVNHRARHKQEVVSCWNQYFENPIIHRQIHGSKIYTPLILDRVWNQIG